nr:hypothetical protein Iba_chr14cCG4410 [Ipomoea batatas]
MDSMHSLRDREYQTPIRNITSMSSLSYTNTIDESTSQSMDLITISDIFETEDSQLISSIQLNLISSFAVKCPSKGDTSFGWINTDQQLLAQLSPDILSLKEDDINTELQLSDGDDDFLEVHAEIEVGESMLYKYH